MSPWAPKTRHEPAAPSDGTSGLLPDGSFETVQDGANTVCAQILGFKFAWYTVGIPIFVKSERSLMLRISYYRLQKARQRLLPKNYIYWRPF